MIALTMAEVAQAVGGAVVAPAEGVKAGLRVRAVARPAR